MLAEQLPPFNLLLIHDKNDKEVSIDQAETLKALIPGAEIMVTSLLGHTRILRNEAVIDKSLSFIIEKTKKPEFTGT